MPSGTVLNGLFVARLHKNNAEAIFEETTSLLKSYQAELTGLAYATPTPEEKEALHVRIDELISDMLDCSWRQAMAEYVINNPEECEDENELHK